MRQLQRQLDKDSSKDNVTKTTWQRQLDKDNLTKTTWKTTWQRQLESYDYNLLIFCCSHSPKFQNTIMFIIHSTLYRRRHFFKIILRTQHKNKIMLINLDCVNDRCKFHNHDTMKLRVIQIKIRTSYPPIHRNYVLPLNPKLVTSFLWSRRFNEA